MNLSVGFVPSSPNYFLYSVCYSLLYFIIFSVRFINVYIKREGKIDIVSYLRFNGVGRLMVRPGRALCLRIGLWIYSACVIVGFPMFNASVQVLLQVASIEFSKSVCSRFRKCCALLRAFLHMSVF